MTFFLKYIYFFCSLKELILDRNDIKELPEKIAELKNLQHISLAENSIEILPSFLLEMRALALTVSSYKQAFHLKNA